jgi:putative Mg2+ transporter-C (MgtC) family protein
MAQARAPVAPATPAAPGLGLPMTGPFRAPRQGKVVAMFGAKGGIGTSVTAVNLAVALNRPDRKAAVVDASLHFGDVYGPTSDRSIGVDPARVAYGVMGGIGFLGAGVIMRYGGTVRGLTTAASLWCTAAMGLACGFGMYLLAALTTALVLFALFVLAKVEERLPTRANKVITIATPSADDGVARFRQALGQRGVHVTDVSCERDCVAGIDKLVFVVSLPARTGPGDLLRLDSGAPRVLQISIR